MNCKIEKFNNIKLVIFFLLISTFSFSCTEPNEECNNECSYIDEEICETETLYMCVENEKGCFVKVKKDDCYKCEKNKCKTKCDFLNCINGTCNEKDDIATCICDSQFHKATNTTCEANNKEIDCKSIIPKNSKSKIGNEFSTIRWIPEDGKWSNPICLWECEEMYHSEDELTCISNNKKGTCQSNESIPENSTEVIEDVDYVWNNSLKEWMVPVCNWKCNDSYIEKNNICTKKGWSKVSVGENHFCGIKSGDLYCWGNNSFNKLGLGSDWEINKDCITNSKKICTTPQKVKSSNVWRNISLGQNHTCGIKKSIRNSEVETRAYCWGDNHSYKVGEHDFGAGKLGIQISNDSKKPIQIVKDEVHSIFTYYNDWSEISISWFHSCGIRNGELYCWGSIPSGIDPIVKYKPYKVGVSNNWIKISNGKFYSCGIKRDGLVCWGQSAYGQLGNNTTNGSQRNQNLVIIDASDKWTDISASRWHSCGIKDDKLYCWGHNYVGQLGKGYITIDPSTPENSNLIPSKIGNDNWKMVTVGNAHSCGIKENGKLYCWGDNQIKQLGFVTSQDIDHCSFLSGIVTSCNTPQLLNNDTWVYVATAFDSTCAINTQGQLYCWGYDGIGNYSESNTCSSNPSCTSRRLPTLIEISNK